MLINSLTALKSVQTKTKMRHLTAAKINLHIMSKSFQRTIQQNYSLDSSQVAILASDTRRPAGSLYRRRHSEKRDPCSIARRGVARIVRSRDYVIAAARKKC